MLEMKAIEKSYGKKQILQSIDLSIEDGVCYGLVGPNGAGKSTIMKIIAGIIHADHGSVRISKATSIGYIPQDICLEEQLSAKVNLAYFGKLYGLGGAHLKKRMDDVLKLVGLTERAEEKVATFSGGMKRRLHIACALLHEPQLILMDEPTVGIDPQSRQAIFTVLHQLQKDGATIIYASHYMEEVEQLCDVVAFIDGGKLMEEATLATLFKKYNQKQVYVKGLDPLPILAREDVVEEKAGGYVITSSTPYDVMTKLLEEQKQKAGDIDRLELVQTRLADVFFLLTGTQLRD